VRYDAADSSAEGETITNNFDNKRFRKDREAFVFALVPEGAPVPRPDAETLAKLDEAVTSGGIEPATGSTGSTGQVAPTTTAAAPTTTAGS
jgi:hypothetical protein